MNKLKRPISYTLLVLVSLLFLGLTLYFLQAPAPPNSLLGEIPQVKFPFPSFSLDMLRGLL